jgi:predicted nucleic acid-binding protein
MNYTIDASVLVAAAHAPDVHHATSLEFLRLLGEQGVNLFCPTLVLAECSAAIARQTDRPILADRAVALIERLPKLLLIPLDISLARRAAQIAISHRLRGADSVYVAVAEEFGATLVTWDAEMLQRGSAAVPTLTPSAWVDRQKDIDV